MFPLYSRRFTLAFLCPLILSSIASAYTPRDPTVMQMVSDGISFLERQADSVRDRGELVLMAYAHFKVNHDSSNELVTKGVAAAKRIVESCSSGQHSHNLNYEAAVATLLLAAIDERRYQNELSTLQRFFNQIQLAAGGFTYHGESLGDVSQTQYVLLAIWTLDRKGFPLDFGKVEMAARWLLRVQDKDGPWPYHGEDPGPNRPLIDQKKTTLSMALAGASSVLIAGDAMRLWGDTDAGESPGIVGLPAAVKLFREDYNHRRRGSISLSADPITQSVTRMNRWRNNYNYRRSANDWYYYQLYTLERFESFVEIASGKPASNSPDWYNQAVDELRSYQTPGGGWEDASRTQPHVSTSLAILFLIRSTRQASYPPSSGTSAGDRSLHEYLSKINSKNENKSEHSLERWLKDLDGNAENLSNERALAANMKLSDEPVQRAAQFERLERLVRGSRSWQTRRVAALVLSSSDELLVAPALIFALSDPDFRVRIYARDGLRFISRKFEGFGMPSDPTDSQLKDAQQRWRAWYRTVRPGFTFLAG